MPIGEAKEKGTFTVPVTFKDEAAAAETPTTITWTLSRTTGEVVNSRSAVSVTAGSAITVTMSGDDLAVLSDDNEVPTRVLTIEITYDSTYGNALPQKNQDTFTVKRLVAVT